VLKGSKVPFIIALGNHDVVFHGSYDSDGVAEAGHGPWDRYSFALWGSVCQRGGGRLTKAGFILQLLDYYESVLKFDFHEALHLEPGSDYPLGVGLTGRVASADWELAFSFRLSAEDSPESHRQSFMFQRWTRRMHGDRNPRLTVTVLDTTDYDSRPALCDVGAKAVQIGLGGAISTAQVRWLESLQPASGTHVVLSHHLPFESIVGISECETTFGANCMRARLARVLPGATFIYGHVHQGFERETLREIGGCDKSNTATRTPPSQDTSDSSAQLPCEYQLVRLPSLIDNKSYVVFENGTFHGEKLVSAAAFESTTPFTKTADTCEQRFFEFLELERNIRCYRDGRRREAGAGPGCPSVASIVSARKSEGVKLCRDLSSAWKAENAAIWSELERTACKDWHEGEHWRCILRGLSNNALAQADLSEVEQGQLGAALLATVQTLRSQTAPAPSPAGSTLANSSR